MLLLVGKQLPALLNKDYLEIVNTQKFRKIDAKTL
jgi:hypothetical protein